MSSLKEALSGSEDAIKMLSPVIALNLWTLFMEGWLYVTRLPALAKYKVDTTPNKIKADYEAKVPAHIKWKADNYNHLMEQPTQFYATAIAMALIGAGKDSTAVNLAWSYVGIRVVHSIFQSTVNIIPIRFGIFATSSLVLAALTVKGAYLTILR